MRFLHLGDLHIGKIVNDFSMIDDQKYILNSIFEMIGEHEVDALLIAGDVYDKAVPSEEAVRVFNDFICRLAEARIKTYIISGNHDSDERLHFGSSLFEKSDIYITSRFDGTLCKHIIENESEKVNVYMLPFVKASHVRRFYPEETIENYEDAVRVLIENAQIDSSENNIILAHQFVCGQSGQLTMDGSENLSVQNVGTIEKIGYDLFNPFDYVALGHIHSPQRVGRDQVRYAGSPLFYSLSEVNHIKSVPMIDITDDKKLEIQLLPLKPRRQMRKLKGPLKKLILPENVVDADDYIFVTLTDEDTVPNALNILREYYPNIMKMEYQNSHSQDIMQADIGHIQQNKKFDELIREFYETMYGCEISEEEMKIMMEVAREVGVEYEAD